MLNSEFRLLDAFLHNPSKELYGRQIERLTSTSHERAVFYLGTLVASKVLSRERKGKQVFYRLNKQNELAQKALAFAEFSRRMDFMKKSEKGFAVQRLVSDIVDSAGTGIYFVILFGSVARHQESEASDIDLLFVLVDPKKTKEKIDGIVNRIVNATGDRFSFNSITLPELENRWLQEPIYRNIWDERIVLYGEENFWKFVLKKGEPSG